MRKLIVDLLNMNAHRVGQSGAISVAATCVTPPQRHRTVGSGGSRARIVMPPRGARAAPLVADRGELDIISTTSSATREVQPRPRPRDHRHRPRGPMWRLRVSDTGIGSRARPPGAVPGFRAHQNEPDRTIPAPVRPVSLRKLAQLYGARASVERQARRGSTLRSR